MRNTSFVAKYGKQFICSCEKGKSVELTSTAEDAMVFDSVEDAAEKLGAFMVHVDLRLARTQLTEKNLVLKATNGALTGLYIKKRAPGHLKGTRILDEAMRFARTADAVRYVKELRTSGYSKNKTGVFVLYNTKKGTEDVLDY